MLRFLSLKLLPKTSKTNPIPLKNVPIFSETANRSHPNRHFFQEHSTWSVSTPARTSDKISHEFFGNPVLAKHFSRYAGLKDQSRNLFDGIVGFRRVQFSRRFFNSFDVGRRSWRFGFQRFTVDGVVLGLIITNVAVFMLWHVADSTFMKKHFMISVSNIQSGRLHTLLTSAFSHMEVTHLVFNMIGLYFFGTHIGGVLGPEYLLKLYLAGALAGSVFYLVYHAFFAPSLERTPTGWIDASRVPGLGASGAVNAIMLLDIFLFPKQTLYLEFIIPVPAILLGIFIIGNDLLRVLKGDSHISGSAHLGGAAVAALAWYRVRRGRFRF